MADFQKTPGLERERIITLHEGAINRTIEYLVGENQAEHIENLVINKIGERTRRGGVRAMGGRQFAPGGVGSYNQADFDEVLVGVWGGELSQSVGDAGWARIASSVTLSTQGLLHDFAKVRQDGQLALAVTSVQQTTEPSATVVYNIETDAATAVSLAGRCLTPFQLRLWVGAEENLYWSDINNAVGFSLTNNFITVEPGLGGNITAIIPSRDNTPKMWIMKEDAVLLFEPRWGSSSALIPSAGDNLDVIASQVRVLTSGAGCIATRSAVWVPGEENADLFFLAADGVRSLQRAENDAQAGAGFPISYNISDWIDRINFTHAHKAAATVFDNAYHLAVPLDGATENTHVLRFDILNNAWSLHDWQAKDVRTFRLGGSSRFFFHNNFRAGDSSVTSIDTSATGPYQVYRGFSGNLDPSEAAVSFRDDSKGLIFGEPTVRKRWDELVLALSSADTAAYNVQVRIDRGPYVDLVNDILPGGDQSIVLADDALPWQFGPEVIRKRSYSLHETPESNTSLPPGYPLQMRLQARAGPADLGKLKVHLSEVRANILQSTFEKDS